MNVRKRSRSPSPTPGFALLTKFTDKQVFNGYISALVGPTEYPDYVVFQRFDDEGKILYKCRFHEQHCNAGLKTTSYGDTHKIEVSTVPHRLEVHDTRHVTKGRLIALGKEGRTESEMGVIVPESRYH
ncbi:hypothetical protein ACQ4LE_004183 [Meloidogyne hapla]|uniref:Rieske domain-containing protein n=1 Tax=Meloidogyne hapla TaxID=6305 RepID=A0A1I8BII0_MELHA